MSVLDNLNLRQHSRKISQIYVESIKEDFEFVEIIKRFKKFLLF